MTAIDPLLLRIKGEAFTGWIEGSVTRTIDQFVPSFELLYSDRWAEADAPRKIQVWDPCKLAFGQQHLLMTGYVDSVNGDLQKDALTIRASGRARTEDLVDCSVRHATGHWRNRTLLQIATELCDPFDITVAIDDTVATTNAVPFERVEADDGESPYDLLQRLCNVRGVLALTTAEGDVRLTRIQHQHLSTLRTVILPTAETLSRSWRVETGDLFSEYFLRTQTGRKKNENGRRAALESYSVRDLSVPRSRPKVLSSDQSARLTELQDHAVWERNTRHGRAVRINYQLPGYLAPDGDVWEPGMLVRVGDDEIGIHDTLVCASVFTQVDKDNVFTRLELTEIESYSTEPVSAKRLVKP
jgi:prophage tail gpP-like protein